MMTNWRRRRRGGAVRRVDPLKDIKDANVCETLELKRTETLNALQLQARQFEESYATIANLQAKLDWAKHERDAADVTFNQLREERGFWLSLLRPETKTQLDAREILALKVAACEVLQNELALLQCRFPEVAEEVLPLLRSVQERIKRARIRAQEIIAERAERKNLREWEATAKERVQEEREIQKEQQAAARKESREKELHRLRAIAATVNDKSRERAETLKDAMRAQFALSKDCPYCFAPEPKDVELDHIIPIQRGGLSTRENLVYVCRQCNHAKSSQTLAMFLKSKGFDRESVEVRLERLGKHY